MNDERAPTNALLDADKAIAAELRWQSRCQSVLAVAPNGLLLYLLRSVLVPFVVAVFLTVGLKPILDATQRRLLPSRMLAVAVVFLIQVTLLALLGFAVASSIDELAHDAAYQERVSAASDRAASIAERLGLLPRIPGNSSDTVAPPSARMRVALRDALDAFRDWLLGGMASLFSSLGVVLIYMLFLLPGTSASARPTGELWTMIEGKLREYIVLKTVISIVTGVAVWLVLAVFQVPLALMLGLLTFLLNYVPNFGPLVTCLLPLPLIWLSPDLGVVSMIAASVLACGVQLVSGNVVEPRLMGKSFDLHPIVVLLALMVWYAIWGFVGMLLSVPMTAALKVVLQRIDRTEWIARLMEGELTVLAVGEGAE